MSLKGVKFKLLNITLVTLLVVLYKCGICSFDFDQRQKEVTSEWRTLLDEEVMYTGPWKWLFERQNT
jgi:hypothetical protein